MTATRRAERVARDARRTRDDVLGALQVYAELLEDLGAVFNPQSRRPRTPPRPQVAEPIDDVPDALHDKHGHHWREVSPGVFTKVAP